MAMTSEDLNKYLFQQLSSIAMGPVSRTSDADMALQILKNSSVDFSNVWNMANAQAPQKKPSGDHTSLFGHIIDIINRPLYATAGFAKGTLDAVENKHLNLGNVLGAVPGALEAGAEGAAKGFTGQDKHTWSELLNSTGQMPDNPVAKFGIGFAADMLGDPLSYVPVGGIAKAGVRTGLRAAGKDIPTFFLPKAEKVALKAQRTAQARAGLSKLRDRTPIVPENQTPNAFQFLSDQAAKTTEGIPGSLIFRAGREIPPPPPRSLLGGAAEPALESVSKGAEIQNLGNVLKNGLPEKLPKAVNMPVGKVGEESPLAFINKGANAEKAFKGIMNEAEQKWAKAAKKYGLREDAKPQYIKQFLEHASKRSNLNPSTRALLAAAKASEDAPVVSTALDQAVRNAGTASQFLSEQSAKLIQHTFNEDAKQVFKANNVSNAAQKTYNDLLGNVLATQRGKPLTVLEKAGTKLNIPVSSTTAKPLRSVNKGRFLKYGTELPTAPKAGSFNLGSSNQGKRIFSFDKVLQSASRADADKIVNSIERPAPKTGVSEAAQGMEQGTKTGGLRFSSSPKNAIPIPSVSEQAVRSGRGVFGPINDQLTKAINERLTTPILKLKPGERLDELTAVQGVIARFATFMGQGDLRPLVLDNMASATARANKRIQALENAFKGHSDQEMIEAWDLARGAKPRELATSPAVSNLADTMLQQMEKYFRSRLVPERFAKGNSVAMRSGMMMKDLNKALNRYKVPFQFTNGAATDPITHAPISYEKGSNWLISWETHIPKNARDLKGFMFGLQSAVDNVIGQYSFIDDVAYRLGSRVKDGARNVKVLHPRLADHFFDRETADQLSTALKTMNDFYSPKSPIMKFFRSAITTWKTGVTIYSPRHHIANFIGDAYLAWIGGVNNPDVFRKAAKVLLANKGQYKDLASVEELVGSNALKKRITGPGETYRLGKNKSGFAFDTKDVYIAAFNYGLLQGAKQIEDLAGSGFRMPIKPFGGKLHNAVTHFAEAREHYVRLAHFIDAIQKSTGHNPAQIFENAAHEVRKWHPDGMDLTREEQALRTYLIPFYSWSRKSIPLLVEGAAMNPHKAFTVYANMNYNVQQALGIQGTSPENPLPADQLFPSWLREDNTPVLGKPGMGGLAGFLGSLGRQKVDQNGNPLNAYTLGGPTNPMQDLFNQFGGFTPGGTTEGVMSSLNPFLRIPLELNRGKQYHGNIPIIDKTDYATDQIPLVNQFARMTNLSPLSGKTGKASLYGVGNREATLNYFTDSNLTGSGPYISMEEKRQKKIDNEKYRQFAASLGHPIKKQGTVPWWIIALYNQRQGN